MSLQDPQSHSDPSATSLSRNMRRYLALALEMNCEDPAVQRPGDIVEPAAPR